MYQFIVSTRGRDICVSDEVTGWSGAAANVGELPDMSHTGSGANKWASRAVVALQLAAWSAVGLVLLEKGVTTLRKNSHNNHNASLEITTPLSPRDWLAGRPLDTPLVFDAPSENDTDTLSVIPMDDDGTNDPEVDEPIRPNKFPAKNDVDKSSERIDANGKDPLRDATQTNSVTIKVVADSLEEHKWESRKRLRVARVHGGSGVAAAVAMVAVGSVMLVLGPAVIVLRTLDERRQERRFLKLSGEEDLPPSYEQATCELEPAPTYSSLNLDSIITVSPPIDGGPSENSRSTSR